MTVHDIGCDREYYYSARHLAVLIGASSVRSPDAARCGAVRYGAARQQRALPHGTALV